ncbi:MAG: reverse transcriptase domain-containing protein [Methylococcaceae bacterium]
MESLQTRHNIRYQRFMDDYLIFAPTRHKLKAELRCMYRVLGQLKLTVHPDKRSIGTTHRGVDFLGYRIHPDRLCVPLCKASTACLSVLVGFMSKVSMKIDSDCSFNIGSVGCMVGYVTGSVMKVALTGFGYLSWNISTSKTNLAPCKRLGLWCLKIPPPMAGKEKG